MDRIHRGDIDAVSLDVGGVLSVPDHGLLGHFLAAAGVAHDRSLFLEGHYRAMAAVDRARSEPEVFDDYNHAFLLAVGVPDDQMAAACAALATILVPPVWHQPVPGAWAAARRLVAAGVRLAVTSNSDGTVAEMLARHEAAQVGPGPGVEIEHVTDSGVLGEAKPAAAMFLTTAEALGLPPERVCHIGDSRTYDAEGAAAVGMAAVHVDPLGLCTAPDGHHHVPSLAAFVDELLGPNANDETTNKAG
jgi:FMN phosphatase YigB (HAD superfamily)